MKTVVNILIGMVLLVVALSFILVYSNTHPPRYPLNIRPSDYHREYEDVTFVTKDGLTLAGWLIKPDRIVSAAGNEYNMKIGDFFDKPFAQVNRNGTCFV
jgi:hypothetical protein